MLCPSTPNSFRSCRKIKQSFNRLFTMRNMQGQSLGISCRFCVTSNSFTKKNKFSSSRNCLVTKLILIYSTPKIKHAGKNTWPWLDKVWKKKSINHELLRKVWETSYQLINKLLLNQRVTRSMNEKEKIIIYIERVANQSMGY